MKRLDLIGTTEAAKILRQTRGTVARRVANGSLHPVGSVGPRQIHVFDRAEIEELATVEREHSRSATAGKGA